MAADDTKPAFLTTREVADLLRVKERKVYEMAAAGALPCRKVTGKLLFPRAEIDALLAGGAPGAGAPPNVVAGSHDPLLDWAIRESGAGLATLFDGSLDGLARIAQGGAVAAGMHVPEDDGWNRALVAERLAGRGFVLLAWATRQQGLILAPAMDGKIAGIADLAGRRVVQRQPSAGAGLLFARLLREAGLAAGDVTVLPDLARTETEAAAMVAAGQAEAAPGLAAMARQFGLPFLPTCRERFDLLISRHAWFEPPLQALWRFTAAAAFRQKAAALGGYDLAEQWQVQWNGG